MCTCEHACSLLPLTPRCCCHFSAYPKPSVQRGSLSIGPSSQKLVLAASVLPVCSLFLAGWQSVCTSCYLSMHSCLSCPLWEAPVPGKFAREDFWIVQNHVALAAAVGRWRHSLQPQCYFVLNTIDTPGAFDVKTMKKRNRWMYSIFILAIWFSTSYFWGVITEKIRAFPRNISNFEKQVVLFTPNKWC